MHSFNLLLPGTFTSSFSNMNKGIQASKVSSTISLARRYPCEERRSKALCQVSIFHGQGDGNIKPVAAPIYMQNNSNTRQQMPKEVELGATDTTSTGQQHQETEDYVCLCRYIRV